MKRAKDQVSSKRRLNPHRRRFKVAHFTYQNDIRRLSQH